MRCPALPAALLLAAAATPSARAQMPAPRPYQAPAPAPYQPPGAPSSQSAAVPGEPPPDQPAPPAETWEKRGTAELLALDGAVGNAETLSIPVGQTVRFGSLSITVRGCVVRPPTMPPDAAAFVVIADSRQGGPGFSGWMLAQEPSLSAFQSPVYDIRLAGCR